MHIKSKRFTKVIKAPSILLIAIVLPFFNLFVSLSLSKPVSALRQHQDYSWTKAIGGTGNDSGMSVGFDSTGNIYFSGRFSSTVDFDPGAGTDNKTSNGGFDVFLSKYTSTGTYVWTKTIGGSGAEMNFGVVLDSTDNIYISSSFETTVDFNPDAGTDNKTSAGSSDIALTKFNADGSYGWTKAVGSTGTDNPMYMTIKQDKIYITGLFSLTVDFNPDAGTDNLTSAGVLDFFVTKFNADGSYGWSQRIGGANSEYVSTIALDSTDNVYATGRFVENTDFDPGAGDDTHTVVDNSGDVFLTKLNSDGSYGWTKTVGSYGADVGVGVAIDSNNNIYYTGYFSSDYGAIDLDPGAGTDNHSTNGIYDIFLTKLSSDGSYVWTKTAGGAYAEYGRNIVIDSQNNVFVLGEFSGTVDSNPGVGTDNRTSAGNSDVFVFKIKANGSYDWSQTMGGDNIDSADNMGMAADSDDNLFITGQYSSTNSDFNPGSGQDIHATNGLYDAFLTKLSARNYYHVTSLTAGIEAKTVDGVSVDDPTVDDGVLAGEEKVVRLVKTGTEPLADVTTDFTTDLDWSSVTADTDPSAHKAFVHNLTAAPGTATTYSLYVPYNTGDNAVTICPGASSLSEVKADCPNVTTYTDADPNVSIVTVDSQQFWKIDGLSSTGGLSTTIVLAATGSPWQLFVQLIAGVMIACSIYTSVRFRPTR